MDNHFVVQRDVFGDDFTLGRMYLEGSLYGFTCEDQDRKLEENPSAKIMHETAIPRGLYSLQVTMSNRFKKLMPLLVSVPGFEGVRVHGGNSHADTSGCILLGSNRTVVGVHNCKGVNDNLIAFLLAAKEQGDHCWIEIK